MKFVEIRDRHTFVPAVAFTIEGADHYLARRAGFESRMVYLVTLNTQKCGYDPYGWNNRTYHSAHLWLQQHWDEFISGGVIDVEYVLGETLTPKQSEAV